jgi:hypothetical protein
MGKHFIPRYYLKGFTEPNTPLFIWVYEKGSNKHYRANIENIAQETDMYSSQTEEYLAQQIEEPAKIALEKLRNRELITINEKGYLANYMGVLYKRVPRSRERAKTWFVEYSKNYYHDLDQRLKQLISENPLKQDLLERRREELKKLKDEETIKAEEVWENIIPPGMTPSISPTLLQMTWQYFVFDKWPAFVTSDSPVFFFEQIGIGKEHSEVTFPISTTLAIWLSWHRTQKEEFVKVNEKIVHEINRRTIGIAGHYIYFSNYENWISRLADKQDMALKRIIPKQQSNSGFGQ